ncbi:MAG TPA: fumarylacetoacetate hydrolase family protein [Burkholderiales bacterium]|nr:fumarylacetoacetate hydrolase family protein [Burkholderiales bacterium]
MKLGSLKDDTRDGALCVVSRDLKVATVAYDVAPTLQAALDDWDYCSRRLQEVYDAANRAPEGSRWFEPDPAKFHAPLPRAYQWLDASGYLSHAERARKARGAELTKELREEPLMYQGDSEAFLGARDPIQVESEDWGIDLEAEIATILDDVPMGVKREKAAEHIRLLMLVNDVTLRNLVPAELAKGFGFLQSKTWTAFAPVAVTPDELGAAWDGRKLHLPLTVHVNGTLLGQPNAGTDMTFDFPRLIAHAAKTRPLGAGTILGSGTVSNKDPKVGVCCLAERRALEMIAAGKASTPFLKYGDRVEIEMRDAEGRSVFGAIEQEVVKPGHRVAVAAPEPAPEDAA